MMDTWYIFTSVVSMVSTVLVGIILNLLYEMRRSNNEHLKQQAEKIDKVQQDVENLRANLPIQYVLRDDFLRSVSNLDTKVDRVASDISEMNKNIGKIVGGELKT